MAKLRVFSWTGGCPRGVDVPGRSHAHQEVRFVVAASSRAAALRAAGHDERSIKSAWARDFVSETGNALAISVATAKPGAVFVHAIAGSEQDAYIEVPSDVT